MTKAELVAEVARLEQLCAVWESATLAAMLAMGLDDSTADRVGDRIRALAPVAGRTGT